MRQGKFQSPAGEEEADDDRRAKSKKLQARSKLLLDIRDPEIQDHDVQTSCKPAQSTAALRSREFVDSYHNKSSLTKKEFVDSPMTTAH